MMKPFNFGGRNSLKPLSISRSLLLIRGRVFHESPFRSPHRLVQGYFWPVLRALPPVTIESDGRIAPMIRSNP